MTTMMMCVGGDHLNEPVRVPRLISAPRTRTSSNSPPTAIGFSEPRPNFETPSKYPDNAIPPPDLRRAGSAALRLHALRDPGRRYPPTLHPSLPRADTPRSRLLPAPPPHLQLLHLRIRPVVAPLVPSSAPGASSGNPPQQFPSPAMRDPPERAGRAWPPAAPCAAPPSSGATTACA